jgi:hypothetical protein
MHRADEPGYESDGGRESAWAELGSNAQRQFRSRVGGNPRLVGGIRLRRRVLDSAFGERATPPLASFLSTDFCGFPGNLPDKAPKLIQDPYTPQPELTYSYYYEMGSELSGTTFYFRCHLADNQILTFCSGQKAKQRTSVDQAR